MPDTTAPSDPPPAATRPVNAPRQWDIFCRVIDNHGDLGVCWRLSAQLADRGHTVRLWVDDASALHWMAPLGHTGIDVHTWDGATRPPTGRPFPSVWLEAFGCEAPEEFIANYLYESSAKCQKDYKILVNPIAWINLEYLTAEGYAQRCHGLPSPVMAGPGRGLTRHFFYPGFTPGTGGLLREPDLMECLARFDPTAWRQTQGVANLGGQWVSLFCYEPKPLLAQLRHWMNGPTNTTLLVAPGRPLAAVQAAARQLVPASLSGASAMGAGNGAMLQPGRPTTLGALTLYALPPVSQAEFDHRLWGCDINFVRGEDSLVRALWAGKALVWHIYPQDDGAHTAKLDAFLDWLQAPADLRAFHHHWNATQPDTHPTTTTTPPPVNWAQATDCVQRAREKLLAQPDLVTQLLDWLATPRGGAHR